MAKTLELKGGLVVALLLLLTGIVGTLFIVLGPQPVPVDAADATVFEEVTYGYVP